MSGGKPKVAFLVVNRAGEILLWGGHASDLTGHRADDAAGKTLDIIVPPDYRDRHWAGFRKAMETGAADGEGVPINLPVRCCDGEIRRFPTRFTLVRDVRGDTIGAAACLTEPSPDDPSLYDL